MKSKSSKKNKKCSHKNIWYVDDNDAEESEVWCKDCGKFLRSEENSK